MNGWRKDSSRQFPYIAPRREGAPARLGPGLRTASGARARWIQQCKNLSPSTTGYHAKITSGKYSNPTRHCVAQGNTIRKWTRTRKAILAPPGDGQTRHTSADSLMNRAGVKSIGPC